ncbi:uncharacterized protein ASCRUDRAFT_30864, partial [Ascoidea rubescens DSM 1968]
MEVEEIDSPVSLASFNAASVPANDIEPEFEPSIPDVLPHEKLYTIQIGGNSFSISGASLSSDSPSYFTNYFIKNPDKTILSIDRSPTVFEKIYSHLQGYHISIETPLEFVYLFSDSFYYNLPTLKKYIYTYPYYFIIIGNSSFKFNKNLIDSNHLKFGNYPNFFSISYNSIFKDPTILIQSKNLIRPPPQAPIILKKNDENLFKIILNIL